MTSTVLVVGASGLVGTAALRHFAARPGWRAIGFLRRPPVGLDGIEMISADLMDPAAVAGLAPRLAEVTHVVFAALYEKPGLHRGLA